MSYQFFATTPKGLELLLVQELTSLGAVNVREKLAGVAFEGELSVGYRACLWSRLANRVFLKLNELPAATPEELYASVQSINWREHIDPEQSIAVHFTTQLSAINHTLFGAQKVKDAIVDQFRARTGRRPNVSKFKPDVQVAVHLHRDRAAISIDLSGESLHRRDYRTATGPAPLKENLAAAVLMRAGWESISAAGGALFDPMCGTGTLLIEAALMARKIAPGLMREYYGFLGWKQHNPKLWHQLLAEARTVAANHQQIAVQIIGYDANAEAIKIAFANIQAAGLTGKIHVEKHQLGAVPAFKSDHGLVVTNPPYGERLGEIAQLQPLYTQLGDLCKAHFSGWQAAVLTANPDLGKVMGVRAYKHYALYNGAIPCKLLLFHLQTQFYIDRSPEAENVRRIKAAQRACPEPLADANFAMFLNRLRKNVKHRLKQFNHEQAVVLYDADLPDYAFKITLDQSKVFVIEYAAPKMIAKEKVLQRQQQVLAVLSDELNIAAEFIYYELKFRD